MQFLAAEIIRVIIDYWTERAIGCKMRPNHFRNSGQNPEGVAARYQPPVDRLANPKD
jgi:hypothetical protein